MIEVKKFTEENLNKYTYDNQYRYSFSGAMRSRCNPLFNNCDDNHDIEDELEKNKVLTTSIDTDTEYSCFWAYFKTKDQGIRFIKRLNKYLTFKAFYPTTYSCPEPEVKMID